MKRDQKFQNIRHARAKVAPTIVSHTLIEKHMVDDLFTVELKQVSRYDGSACIIERHSKTLIRTV